MTAPSGEDPVNYSPKPISEKSVMRRLMWGGVFLHVVGLLALVVVIIRGDVGTSVFWGCLVLSASGGFWVIWCRNEDQQERSKHLFVQTPKRREFSDMREAPK